MRIYDLLPSIHERLKIMPQNEIEALRTDMKDKYDKAKLRVADGYFTNHPEETETTKDKLTKFLEDPYVRGLMVFPWVLLTRWCLKLVHPELFPKEKGEENGGRDDSSSF